MLPNIVNEMCLFGFGSLDLYYKLLDFFSEIGTIQAFV